MQSWELRMARTGLMHACACRAGRQALLLPWLNACMRALHCMPAGAVPAVADTCMRCPSRRQVLFLLYHYFNAREIYNAIRVFIAGYVWMTGYGNFMYYYHYKDFCLGRCGGCAC